MREREKIEMWRARWTHALCISSLHLHKCECVHVCIVCTDISVLCMRVSYTHSQCCHGVGSVFGTLESLRQGIPGAYKLRFIGQYTLISTGA